MPENERWFHSQEDRQRIRQSAETDWGRPIVESLKKQVAERLTHSLVVPATEVGHYHHYFCSEHKRLLTFDWDSPHRHYCPECKSWLEGDRYDYAWLRFIHGNNQVFMRNCALLSIITGDRQYLEHIRSMLLDYANRYPYYKIHGHDMKPDAPYGGRMFCQTLDEANWIVDIAPAYAEAKSILTREEIADVENHLLRPVAETILRNQTGGNWQVWHNAGVAVVAVAVGDEALLQIALNDPVHGYNHMMETGVTAEGWWDERSPGYHFYPLHAMLCTAEAVRCRGIDLYDGRLRALFTAPLRCVYADLTFPAHNDGWHGISLMSQSTLYELAALRFNEVPFQDLLSRIYSRKPRNSWTALLNGEDIITDSRPLQLESCIYRDTGVAFLRSASRTVVLKYGPHGGGHGHPDKLSISIHDGKREILPDLGTPGYGVPDYVGWYRKTVAHNTVTVDEKDQQETAGELIQYVSRSDGGIVEAHCDTAYPGVQMKRRVQLSCNVLSESFICESTDAHTYDYVLLLSTPVSLPQDATAIQLSGKPGYDRIQNARQWDCSNETVFQLASVRLSLKCDSPFKLISGEAPGKPGSTDVSTTMNLCYPLIVRITGTRMQVQATWSFDPPNPP